MSGTTSALADGTTIDSPVTKNPGASYEGNLTICVNDGYHAAIDSAANIYNLGKY